MLLIWETEFLVIPKVQFTNLEIQFPWRKALCSSSAMHKFMFRTIDFSFLSVLLHFLYYTKLYVGIPRKPINSNLLPVLGLHCSAIVLLFPLSSLGTRSTSSFHFPL